MRDYTFDKATFRRLGEIGRVLSKYGLGEIAERLRLPKRLHVRLGRTPPSLGEKLKAILEELGPTYIKLGQALSCHPDVLSPDIIRELAKLQERVDPFPFAQVRRTIARTLKKHLEEVFQEFESVPFAAASLSQVHQARLPTGEKVAVKVQRPGLEETVRGDLNLMHALARVLEERAPELGGGNLTRLVSEFERSIEKEIDFRLEADNYERFRKNFADDPGVHFPRVYREFSGRDVLTLEYIHGAKIDSVLRSDTSHDRELVAHRGANAVLRQIFEDGFFHADPHKGNLIIMKDDVVCFLDAGMVGALAPDARELLDRILVGIANCDVPALVSVMWNEDMVPENTDLREFQEDLDDLFDRYYGADLENIDIAAGLGQFLGLIRKYRVRLPADFIKLIRCLIIVEGVGRQLAPDFNPARSVQPYARKALERKFEPKEIIGDIGEFLQKNVWMMKSFPGDLMQFLHRLVRGKSEWKIDHRGLEELNLGIKKASSRLAGGVLAAGVIIASALIIRSNLPPLVGGFSLLGLLGYVGSLVFAVVMFARIFRDIR
ncbi:MAG TPA: AarF/ABC1/UbiB kinase family protein [Thermoanaerobaculaceae bacterium]|nr:AarF/ABC1/UbiB kinase family protein [Thermoanaerobaculaceae bacterium]